MKFALAFVLVLFASAANAAETTSCVAPHWDRGGTKFYTMSPVYRKPDDKTKPIMTMNQFGAYIGIRSDETPGWVRIVAPKTDDRMARFHPGYTIGWMKAEDVDEQDLRNCNL